MKAYDIIIIGAGVTGLASAMYAGRLNLKTLVIGTNSSNELPIGGVITLLNAIVCGHVFLNGNKRTGTTLMLWFFDKNNILYDPNLVVRSIINIAKIKKPNFRKIQKEINKCPK